MNEIINKFLLAGDTFMPKIHLRQDTALSKPEFIYSGCVPFTKNNQRIQKVKETRDSRHIYQSELDYARFQHDMIILNIYQEEQPLIKYYEIRLLILLKIQTKMDMKVDLLQWFLHFLIKKQDVGNANKSANDSTHTVVEIVFGKEQLAGKLHKLVIRTFENLKINSSFRDKIWGADLADMQIISKWLQGNGMEMHSAHNEKQFLVFE